MELWVKTPSAKYPIYWQKDENTFNLILKNFIEKKKGNYFVVTDKNVFLYYEKILKNIFEKEKIFVLPAGEKTKSFFYLEKLCNDLLKKGADRKTCLIAFGGGVVGDLTGFAASVYMRGISYAQVPTTLLSMVDSSVGGKTAINLKDGKNMVGAFYQPEAVFMNVCFLESLPANERKSGLAEVVKSAVIANRSFLKFISDHIAQILAWEKDILEYLSVESVKIKAKIVESDEKEVSGKRAMLNFGHTLGHALETYLNYSQLTHGECVSVGMAFAAYLSFKKGYLTKDKFNLFFSLLGKLNLPKHFRDVPKKIRILDILALMKKDKKNYQGKIHMILLKDLGRCLLPEALEEAEVKEALHEFYNYG